MKKFEVIPENVSKYMEEAAAQRGQITPQQQLQQQQAQQLYLQQQMSQGQVSMGMMSGNGFYLLFLTVLNSICSQAVILIISVFLYLISSMGNFLIS